MKQPLATAFVALAALAASVGAVAQGQAGLKGLDRGMTGPRAQVMVLGTVHLSQLPASLDPAALQGLLDRLARFKPDVITIEALPGEECDLAARHPAKYGANYCASTAAAQAATGLDVPAALAAVTQALKAWPAQPGPAQRRHLAALFLAASEPASACVQWLQLPEDERRAGDGLDAALAKRLDELAVKQNEDYLIAARLAARLGLARVHPVDNHTGDNVQPADEAAFGRAITAAWKAGRSDLEAREVHTKALSGAPDLLPLYRYVNAPGYQRALAGVNVTAALRATSPEGYPQMWVAGWETRNLRMVANVREAFRERPGARVLAIVGASHKPWFDAWLGQQQGVDIVDVGRVLD